MQNQNKIMIKIDFYLILEHLIFIIIITPQISGGIIGCRIQEQYMEKVLGSQIYKHLIRHNSLSTQFNIKWGLQTSNFLQTKIFERIQRASSDPKKQWLIWSILHHGIAKMSMGKIDFPFYGNPKTTSRLFWWCIHAKYNQKWVPILLQMVFVDSKFCSLSHDRMVPSLPFQFIAIFLSIFHEVSTCS